MDRGEVMGLYMQILSAIKAPTQVKPGDSLHVPHNPSYLSMNGLIMPVAITIASSIRGKHTERNYPIQIVNALFDTGCSKTSIDYGFAQSMGLIP